MGRLPRQSPLGAAVARLPPRPHALQLVPSGRSVVVALAVALLALSAYFVARETPVFAVRTIEVEGAPAPVARRVERALRPLEGRSLLELRGDEVSRLATALPYVAAASYDRAFPNTLRVRIEPEQPLAVVRHGVGAWLVSRRGRVMRRIAQGTHRKLPRIWLAQPVDISLGATLPTDGGGDEIAMLAPLRDAHLARKVARVKKVDGQYVYMLRSGLALRVGRPTNLPLKLAIARQILTQTSLHGYLDVSVPNRAVAASEAQVSG